MNRMITFETNELKLKLVGMYNVINETAWSATLTHVNNRNNKDYNTYHFTETIRKLNVVINIMKDMLDEDDKYRDNFQLLSETSLTLSVEDFIKQDIY